MPGLLWLFYLSLTVVGQVFLGYQWDSLLLEAGLLALLLTPWCLRLDRSSDLPWPFAVWMFRWLVFRLMFQSGVVKLTSGDPVWRTWKALDYHYQTQPLPAWTSWYFHQMPAWFQTLSLAFMFYAELVAPFFIFGPRTLRRIGFISLVLFQALIAATGNYGFFNLLTAILCLSLLDDRDWCRVVPAYREKTDRVDRILPAPKPWSWPRRVAVGVVAGIVFAITAGQTLETVWPAVVVPVPLQVVSQSLEPLRIANPYGLFRVMTVDRPEITVEGSDDGGSWKPYRFRWKPGEFNRRPRFATPHMPRLDWQLWFAALAGDCRAAPWFLRFNNTSSEARPKSSHFCARTRSPTGHPDTSARACPYTHSADGARTIGGPAKNADCSARVWGWRQAVDDGARESLPDSHEPSIPRGEHAAAYPGSAIPVSRQ